MKRISIAAFLLSFAMTASADWSVTKDAVTDDGDRFQAALAETDGVSALIICMIDKDEFKFSLTTPDYVPLQPITERKWFMMTINGNAKDPYFAIANGGDLFDGDGDPRSVKAFIRKIRMKKTLTISIYDNAPEFGTRTASDTQDVTLIGVTAATDKLGCTI